MQVTPQMENFIMTDRHITSRPRGETDTIHGGIEMPWGDQNSFRQLNNFQPANTGFSLPNLDINSAGNPARNQTDSPHIINLVGGGTKDLRLADEPGSDEGGGGRRRLSASEYAEKLKHTNDMDIVKIKKSFQGNRSKDV